MTSKDGRAPDCDAVEDSEAPAFSVREMSSCIGNKIGGGAFGGVYSLKGCPRLAVKEIPIGGQSAEELAASRFEVTALTELSHPGILRCHQALESGEFIYIIMDRYNETLKSFMSEYRRSSKAIPSRVLLSILQQIAGALDYLHNLRKIDASGKRLHGIVHRDLKPENILVSGDKRRFVLSDFGLSKNALRSSGTKAGTPTYMAPETALYGETSTASDIWSLGVITYELATLNRPNFLNGRPPKDVFVSGWRPDLSTVENGALRGILEQIFVLDPERRPFASELVETLQVCSASPDAGKPDTTRISLDLLVGESCTNFNQGNELFKRIDSATLPNITFHEGSCTLESNNRRGPTCTFSVEHHNPVFHRVKQLIADRHRADYKIIEQFLGSDFKDIDPLDIERQNSIRTFFSSTIEIGLMQGVKIKVSQPSDFFFTKIISGGKCGRFYHSLRCISALVAADNGNRHSWNAMRIARLSFFRTLEATGDTFCAMNVYCIVLSLFIFSLMKRTGTRNNGSIYVRKSSFSKLEKSDVVIRNPELYEMLFTVKGRPADDILKLLVPFTFQYHNAVDTRIHSYTDDQVPYPFHGVDTEKYAKRIELQRSIPSLVQQANSNDPLEILKLLVAPGYLYRCE